MRNLKKFLALVLALMMVVSVMVTVNAASYDDDADIDYKEAVAVMSGIGVLQGDGNGNFFPDETLTRKQAAEIIAKMMVGPETVKVLPAADSFSDVKATDWGSGSVNYCSVANIVVGDGAGHFYPDQEVTGYQFGKMLLVALGANSENFVGSGWELNVMTTLRAYGLDAGLTSGLVSGKPLTREAAAQMAFNTVMSERIETDGTFTVGPDGSISWTPGNKNTASMYETVFGGVVDADGAPAPVTGVLQEVAGNDATSAKNGTITVKISGGTTKTFKGEADLDLVGHQVKVYYTEAGKKGSVAGTAYAVVDDATLVATINVTSSNKLAKGLEDAGFKTGDTAAWFENYNSSLSGGTTLTDANAPFTVTAISNNSNLTVDYYSVVTRDLSVITNVRTNTSNGKTVTTYYFEDNGSYTNDKIDTKDTLAKGDIVWLTPIDKTMHVEKAEILEGAFGGMSTKSGTTTYTFGGTGYKLGTLELDETIGSYNFLASLSGLDKDDVGDAYKFVLNSFGTIAAIWPVDEETVTVEYAYLAAFGEVAGSTAIGGNPTTTYQALLYFADGTSKTVTIDTNSDAASNEVDNPFNPVSDFTAPTLGTNGGSLSHEDAGVYAYEVQSNGSYLLYQPATKVTSPAEVKTNVVGTASSASVYGNANSITFSVKGKYGGTGSNALSVSVIKGVDGLKGATLAASDSFYASKSGTLVYTAGLIGTAGDTVSTNKNVYYYAGTYAENTDKDGTSVTYEVYLDGEKTSLTYKGTAASLGSISVAKGIVVENATGTNITAPADNTSVTGYVTDYYEGTLTVQPLDANGKPDGDKVIVQVGDDYFDVTKDGDFSSYDEADVTVKVSVAYETKSGVSTAKAVYITAVQSCKAEIVSVDLSKAVGGTNLTITLSDITAGAATFTVGGTGTKSGLEINNASGVLKDGVLTLSAGASAKVYSAYTSATEKTENDAGALVDGDKIVVTAEDGLTVTVYTVDGIAD